MSPSFCDNGKAISHDFDFVIIDSKMFLRPHFIINKLILFLRCVFLFTNDALWFLLQFFYSSTVTEVIFQIMF